MIEDDDFVAWYTSHDRFDGYDRGDLDNDPLEEQEAYNEYCHRNDR